MSDSSFLDEQADAGGSGLRALKRPGDPQWCWQTISRLQSLWKSLNIDFESYMTTWREAEDHEVWAKVPYQEPFGTKEEMLKQLEIGDDEAARQRIACQAIAARAERYAGGSESKSNHLVARISRMRPDIVERMKKGEFPSVAAAAREAGIDMARRKKTLSLSDNVDMVADRLLGHYTPEQVQRIVERLSQDPR